MHGRYKLADFGFAKFEGEGSREKPQYLMGGTRTFGKKFDSRSKDVELTNRLAPRCPRARCEHRQGKSYH